jgi:hypothetical protein
MNTILQLLQALGQWIGPSIQTLSNFFVGLFTWDLLFITGGIGVIVQGIKVLLQLRWQNVSTPLIIWVIGPVAGIGVAWKTWSYDDQVPWWLAGIVCSGLANLAYWLIVEKYINKVAPHIGDAINLASTQGKFSPP